MRSVRWLFALALMFPVLPPLHAAAAPRFDSAFDLIPTEIAAYEPASNALGDLDGDGRAELVSVSDIEHGIKTYRADAQGRFHYVAYLNTNANPKHVRLADLDHDGKLDAVLGGNDIWGTARGLGNGSFGPVARFAMSDYYGFVRGVEVADLNRDGWQDLILWQGNRIAIRLNAGGGAIDSAQYVYTGATALAVADVVGDATPEIVFTADAKCFVLMGAPTTGYSEPLLIGPGSTGLAVADLDHDGRTDLVSGSHVYRGTNGGLVEVASTDLDAQAIADVDADGLPDLLGVGSNRLEIARGRGDLTFETKRSYPAGKDAATIAIGDIDADGRMDLVVGQAASRHLSLYRQQSTGFFPSLTTFPTSATSRQVLLADLTKDGHADALVLNSSGALTILAGNGTGALAAAQPVDMGGPIARVLLDDFNGDGLMDLAGVRTVPGTLVVRLANGSGGFVPAQAYAAAGAPIDVVSGDFDEDGSADLAVLDDQARMDLFLNSGSGAYGAPLHTDRSGSYSRFGTADIDADGHLDVFGVFQGRTYGFGDEAYRWRGFGTGEVESNRQSLGASARSESRLVRIRDLNGLGFPEVILATNDSTGLINASLGFGYYPYSTGPLAIAPWVSDLLISDLDGDGRAEAITASQRQNVVSLTRLDQNGSPVPVQDIAVDDAPSSIASGDLNEDGRLDLVVVHSGAPTAVVLLDRSEEAPPRLATPPTVHRGDSDVSIDWRFADGSGRWARVLRNDQLGTVTVSEPVRLDDQGRWSYIDGEITAGTLYTYRLLVDTEDGPCVAGLARVKVYPSGFAPTPTPLPFPMDRRLAIASPSHGSTIALGFTGFLNAPVEVTLHNVAGRVVGRWSVTGASNVQLSRPSDLAPGVYLVRASQDGSAVTKRVILL